MDKPRINYLLQKYIDGSITASDKQELLDLYKKTNLDDAEYPDDRDSVSKRMLLRLNNEIQQKKTKTSFFKSWTFKSAAAATLIILGGYIVSRQVSDSKLLTRKAAEKKEVMVPGTNLAVLTLGNGKKILLNGTTTGKLAVQGNTTITKNAAGQISYTVAANKADAENNEVTFNTITTPIGGQFRVTLPDGSNVWLNAASSLKYPSRFEGSERHVELHGEAYFEIFKNKNSPFTVSAENVNIRVLGTHFNVMAYKNEPAVNTTLLEGSVTLTSGRNNVFLVPGQQAVADPNAENIAIHNVNVEDAVAWKNGYFSFRKQNIKTAMNKIARWYNADVEYSGNVNNKFLGGSVSRSENISELLNYLELTGIAKFKIDGRRITVICK
ncbi:FecR family protein [Mucilaginibacter xinganensis]|uniref:FecR family protein n=1 Tax=Mucilaginibacter xinganensis TaxID=1234841 RepID=A0A223NZY4_9SPHI|nr:FecR family protein [Mucilaginibacter xinganensis]ASU35449.1 FecR family protein [Mucilaginibacter xinganensis]